MSENGILETDIRYIKGVGSKRAGLFNRLGVFSLRDLISFFPRDYEDRSKIAGISGLAPGVSACVRALVAEPCTLAHIRAGLDIVKTRAVDEGGSLELVFFNQRYVKDALKPGKEYVFFGRVSGSLLRPEMCNPVFEPVGGEGFLTGRIVPVYRLCAGLSRGMATRAVAQGLALCGDMLPDFLPDGLRARHGLAHARFAYENIHFPESFEALGCARRRLVFEELFLLSLGLMRFKERRSDETGLVLGRADMEPFYRALPFELTGSQRRAIEEALGDMTSGRPMNRLVQGDVGSGKTAVAAACAYFAKQSGYQTALMAPTSILAEQHYGTLSAFFAPLGLHTALLTAGTRNKAAVLKRIAGGEADLVIGTHALISGNVEFQNLGLAVTDEQHRFGVRQRAALSGKSAGAHVLVMSATPIPRTLALILYGDLDVSVMDDMPPGRQKVDTFVVGESMRARIEAFVRKLVSAGRQVYVICPLVEEDESDGGRKAVTSFAEKLKNEVYPELRVSCVHGRMKACEKEAVMRAFSGGGADILVSTTVIEVGVNVPNAALMIVENAERYGLSQLHQLRGRVGRGEHKSYCVLFTQSDSEATRKRLEVLARTNDGFEIAGEDLKLRGPGDFFGSRQHGLPQLRVADLANDMQVLREAQQAAALLNGEDPELAMPENRGVRDEIVRMFSACADGNIFN